MTLQERLRRLAWDFSEWSLNPPLISGAEDQRRLAAIFNDAANSIDESEASRRAAFGAAIEECELYVKNLPLFTSGGGYDAAMQIAMRIAQRARRGA